MLAAASGRWPYWPRNRRSSPGRNLDAAIVGDRLHSVNQNVPGRVLGVTILLSDVPPVTVGSPVAGFNVEVPTLLVLQAILALASAFSGE